MNDYIIRATAANDQIRAFAAVTTRWWRLQENTITQVRLRQQPLADFSLQEP